MRRRAARPASTLLPIHGSRTISRQGGRIRIRSLFTIAVAFAAFCAISCFSIVYFVARIARRASNLDGKVSEEATRKAPVVERSSDVERLPIPNRDPGRFKVKDARNFEHFLTPDLEPGHADLLRFENDGSVVQSYAARVGLPLALVPTIVEYAKEMGLYDIMENMLYDDPLPPDGSRWLSFQSPYQKESARGGQLARNLTWSVGRPAKMWKSDMHWFDTADERAHEDALRALARGGFDTVLQAIGEAFDLDSLHVDSVGFVAVTNCDRGYVHTDWDLVDGRAFNFLVGIESPEGAGPELVVEGDRSRKGEVHYRSDAGILVGDGTRHGTRECDHRAVQGVRITCSIYLADATEDILDTIAGDTTSIFPPTGRTAREWVWAQRGRHWRRDGESSLVGDLGRRSFEVGDNAKGCTEEDCTHDTEKGRNVCLKTCNVFIEDSEYNPGKERSAVLGY
ncbi:hypothetical protein ACHAWF_009602 [Thalassiosira exigua]